MRNTIVYISIFIVCLGILVLAYTKWASRGYFDIGTGPIVSVEKDINPNQLIVVSGSNIYVINTTTGAVVEDYILPDIYAVVAKVGSPDGGLIYGGGLAGTEGIVFRINRLNSEVTTCSTGHDASPVNILQDSTRLFALTYDNENYMATLTDYIRVIDKTAFTETDQWLTVGFPEYAIRDPSGTYIIAAERMPQPHSDDEEGYSPWDSGVQWYTRLGWNDINREGQIVNEVLIEASIDGLAIMDDNTVIAGTLGIKENPHVPAHMLAIVNDPIEYIDIGTYHIKAMDYEASSNRIFCSLLDYEAKESGYILVWDYDTREYEIIDTGIDGYRIVRYLDDKIYATPWDSNRIYVIDID